MRTHIVQKGDTLWKIAKQYGIGFEELKRLNSHLANPDYIVPGMEIILPDDTVGSKQPTKNKEKVVPEKAKPVETPPKAKQVEEVPKAKPVEKEIVKPEVPVTPPQPVPVQPAPQIIPMPQPMPIPIPIQQIQPAEKPEFHLDFSPQFSFQPPAQPVQSAQPAPQIMPMPQPIPQPIFIELPSQPAPQPVKEEKEKIVEKEVEYVPVPQTHVEYIPVPQPIYIYCMPVEHHHPCHCKHPKVEPPCGCSGRVQQMRGHNDLASLALHQDCYPGIHPQMDYYPQVMPYGQPTFDYGQVMPSYAIPEPYSMPQVESESDEIYEDTDWLFESTSTDQTEQVKGDSKEESDHQQMNYYPFKQATEPIQVYYPMQQGYIPPMDQTMYQQMQPGSYAHFDPYMQQCPTNWINPCAPYFNPWSS